MDRDQLLRRIRAALEEAFGPRLRGVLLYGSEARGQAGPDSDVDLLVLLDKVDSWWDDSGVCIGTLYPLVLQSGRPIHCEPVGARQFETYDCPLHREVKREGVAI